jgi:hypothetical protein
MLSDPAIKAVRCSPAQENFRPLWKGIFITKFTKNNCWYLSWDKLSHSTHSYPYFSVPSILIGSFHLYLVRRYTILRSKIRLRGFVLYPDKSGKLNCTSSPSCTQDSKASSPIKYCDDFEHIRLSYWQNVVLIPTRGYNTPVFFLKLKLYLGNRKNPHGTSPFTFPSRTLQCTSVQFLPVVLTFRCRNFLLNFSTSCI